MKKKLAITLASTELFVWIFITYKRRENEMGKRVLCMGVLLGAIVGGLATLLNGEARAYTKGKVASCKVKTGDFIKHPSEAVRNTRVAFDQLNARFTDNAANVINALEQVENTLDKVSKKEQPEQEALPLEK